MKLVYNGALKSFLIVALLLTFANMASGQPGGGKPCPKPPCPASVPITGIEILLAAGGALGLKKVLGRKNKTTE
jgi:hypothetical protein